MCLYLYRSNLHSPYRWDSYLCTFSWPVTTWLLVCDFIGNPSILPSREGSSPENDVIFILFLCFFFTVVKVYDIIYRKPEKWCNDLCFCLAECLEGCVLPIRGCDVNVWWLKRCLWCPVSCLLTQPRGSRNNKDLKAGVKILLGKSTLKYTFERLVLLLYVNSARRPLNQKVWGWWRGLVHSWLHETTWIISAKMTKTHVILLWRSDKTGKPSLWWPVLSWPVSCRLLLSVNSYPSASE